MDNTNPFIYGRVVSGENFIDRERELQELGSIIRSGKSVILYSPRGMGKTSLIQEFFTRLPRGYKGFIIDMFGTPTRDDLAKELVRGLASSVYGTLDKIKRSIGDFLRNLRFEIVLTPEGEMRFELSRSPSDEDLAMILDLPERIGREKGMTVVVAFDEFQEVEKLDGEELEKLMRSRFQHHQKAVYIFTGSRRHMIHQIFGEERRAFYRFGRSMELGPIPRNEFAKYIKARFEKSGGKISEAVVDRILDLTGGHPSFTQQLCYELWFISRNAEEEALVEEAVRIIITHEERHYLKIWENLTQLQRKLLRGLAREEIGPYSQQFISKYGLGSPANVRRGLELLEKRGIVEEGKISDVFFKEWLKRR
jgi:AAA+ ATPase superfamily predicted ATPase